MFFTYLANSSLVISSQIYQLMHLFPSWFDDILKSGILSFIAILVAIGIFFYQQYRERKIKKEDLNGRLRRICDALLIEVNSIDLAFNSDTFPKIKENGIEFTNTSIGTEIYHSVLNSGLFTYFDKTTQIDLGIFYYQITRFNYHMDLMTQSAYSIKDMTNFRRTLKERLTGLEKE